MATLEEGSAANAARELGQGWKVNPYIRIKSKQVFTLAEIDGPGAIQHIWMTPAGTWRYSILRFYWDDETEPSIEVPVGDFFAAAYEYKQISSLPVAVNPGSAFNCYWVMPFHKKCRITMENLDEKEMTLYYQIDYTLRDVPKDACLFSCSISARKSCTLQRGLHNCRRDKRQRSLCGTYMAWQTNNNGWWGEGEIKFFMDGDKKFPTICGTGTEDYFCGSYGFAGNTDKGRQYIDYTTPYVGFHVIRPDDNLLRKSQTRFGMYRWHIQDPVRFDKDLKVTMQALGWRSGGRYLPLQDDIASVAFWYQQEPHHSLSQITVKRRFGNYNRKAHGNQKTIDR